MNDNEITKAAAAAFNNTFHKCRADVSMDWWQRIWAKAVEWERKRAAQPAIQHVPVDDTEGGAL
jgi:hypothetical protein